jgi:hypothetical protein
MLSLAGCGIQRAEAPVAVRLERAHAQFLGQRQRLLVVVVGLGNLSGLTLGGNRAQEAENASFVGALGVLPRVL